MKRVVPVTAVILLLMITGAYVSLRVLLSDERVAALVVESVSSSTGLPATVGGARFSPGSRLLTVRDLCLARPGTGDPIALLAEGEADVRLLPLLAGTLDVKEIVLSDLVVYPNLRIAHATLILEEPGIARLGEIAAEAFGGEVVAAGSVDFSAPGDPACSLYVNLRNADADEFLSVVSGVEGVLFGDMEMEAVWKTHGVEPDELLMNLSGEGTARVKEGAVRDLELISRAARMLGREDCPEARFRELETSFHIGEERVEFRDMRIRADGADLDVAGLLGFNGVLDLNASIRLSDDLMLNLGGSSVLFRFLADENGRIPVDLRLTGTTEQPEIAVDFSAPSSRSSASGLNTIIRKLAGDKKVNSALNKFLSGFSKKSSGETGASEE